MNKHNGKDAIILGNKVFQKFKLSIKQCSLKLLSLYENIFLKDSDDSESQTLALFIPQPHTLYRVTTSTTKNTRE